MRSIIVLGAALAAFAMAVPAVAADDLAPAGQYSVWCDSYEIRLAAGAGAAITRDRDGRVTVFGRRGEQAAASCSGGCLAASPGAICTIVRPVDPPPAIPAFVVSCPEGDSFELERGNSGGSCSTQVDDSNNVTGGECDDDAGNRAEVDCSANGGQGRCVEESGSTTCNRVGGG